MINCLKICTVCFYRMSESRTKKIYATKVLTTCFCHKIVKHGRGLELVSLTSLTLNKLVYKDVTIYLENFQSLPENDISKLDEQKADYNVNSSEEDLGQCNDSVFGNY